MIRSRNGKDLLSLRPYSKYMAGDDSNQDVDGGLSNSIAKFTKEDGYEVKPNGRKMSVVFSPRYALNYEGIVPGVPEHPIDHNIYPHLRDGKLERVRDLLRSSKARDRLSFIEPAAATVDELASVHSEDYLDSLKVPKNVFDCFEVKPKHTDEMPNAVLSYFVEKQMLDPLKYIVGGSVLAAERAVEDGISVNLGGGFHHASRDAAGGFCVYNDIAIAARHMQRKGYKVLVVDLDVHQGDGTARIFEDDEDVFVFSMHEDDIYPPRKAHSDLDVGLEAGINDSEYLSLLRQHLPEVMDRFKPDIVFYVAGVDVYRNDALSNLGLTRQGVVERDVYVASETRKRKLPLMMTLAGGYSEDSAEIHAESLEKIAELV